MGCLVADSPGLTQECVLPLEKLCFCQRGRTTDPEITVTSGLFDYLEPGDVVLADKVNTLYF
jgi:hypothetical protein